MEINGIVWRAKREGPEFRTGCMRQGSLTYAKVLHCRQTRDVTTRPTHYPDPGYGAHAHCAHATASILCREPRCHSHAHYSILYSTEHSVELTPRVRPSFPCAFYSNAHLPYSGLPIKYCKYSWVKY